MTNSRALLAAVLVSVTSLVSAQSRLLPDAPGTWKPWKPFSAVASARSERGVTPAELKAFEAELLALEAILERAPAVTSPRGFSVETWGALSGYRSPAPGQPLGRALPLAGSLDFGAFPIFEYEKNGTTVREDTGETELLLFQVNELGPWLIGGSLPDGWSNEYTDAFLQPQPAGDLAGFPRFGDILVIKKNPASVFAPVALATALALERDVWQRQVSEQQHTVESARASLADWQNPQKKAARLEGYKVVAATQPSPATYLATMETFEKEQDARLQLALTPTGDAMKRYLDLEHQTADLTAWLDSLSAADRQEPACYVKGGASPRQRFRGGLTAGCVPIARPNWSFFNKALPRTVPQLLVIGQVSRCFDRQPATTNTPAGCPTNRQLLLTWDRQAVLDWLK